MMTCNTLKKLASALSAALLVLVLAKMLVVTFASPLMGYANNWDFTRQSACNGIWLMTPDGSISTGHADDVYNSLLFSGKKQRHSCIRSSDNVFSKLATHFHAKGENIDFRFIGGLKLLAAVLGALALWWLARSTAEKALTTLLLALVLGDMANLLYVNTFYNEFSVILGIVFCMAALVLLVRLAPGQPVTWHAGLLVVFTLWLGVTKQQYMPLGIFMAAVGAAILLRQGHRRAALALIVVALCIPAAYTAMNRPGKSIVHGIGMANNTNTLLFTVLPASPDAERALEILKLPTRCAANSGLSWYDPALDHQNHPCPEVAQFSRLKLLALFAAQPETLLKPMAAGLRDLPPFHPAYLAHLEDAETRHAARYQLLWRSSLSHWANQALQPHAPRLGWFVWLCVAVFMVSPALVLAAVVRRPHAYGGPLLLAGLGGMVMLYSIFSSIYGDGYIEVVRHSSGFLVGMAALVAGLLGVVATLAGRRLCRQRS